MKRTTLFFATALGSSSLTAGCTDSQAELCDEPDSGEGGDEVGVELHMSVEPLRMNTEEFRVWGGVDPRVPVIKENELQSYPLRTVSLVSLQTPDPGGGFILSTGTGFLVGPRHLLTNRHVIDGPWGDTLNDWIVARPAFFHFDVFPGRSNETLLNGGAWPVERVLWNPFPETKYNDYVLLVLEDDAGRSGQYGRIGLCSASGSTLDGRAVFSAGFPAATKICDQSPENDGRDCPCAGWMYYQSCEIEEVDPQELIHSCVTQSGQSGSPLWVDDCDGNHTRCSVGIVYGKSGFDGGAVRWRDDDLDWLHSNICEWTSDYAEMPAFCD